MWILHLYFPSPQNQGNWNLTDLTRTAVTIKYTVLRKLLCVWSVYKLFQWYYYPECIRYDNVRHVLKCWCPPRCSVMRVSFHNQQKQMPTFMSCDSVLKETYLWVRWVVASNCLTLSVDYKNGLEGRNSMRTHYKYDRMSIFLVLSQLKQNRALKISQMWLFWVKMICISLSAQKTVMIQEGVSW